MGPFELMDLIGLDVNYAVTSQIWESYHRHPRFEPSVLQKELVDAGQLGRKSGKGFFEYGKNEVNSSAKNAQPTLAPDSVILEGQGKLPESLQKLLKGGSVPMQNNAGDGNIRFSEGTIVVPSNGKSSTERSSEIGQSVISIDLCLDFEYSSRVVLAPAQECPDKDLQQAVGLFQSLGKKVSLIKDSALTNSG